MKKGLSMLLIIVMAALVFAGCGAKEASETSKPAESETTLTGTLSIAGSTTVAPPAQALADAFEARYPETRVDVQGIGSSAGMKMLNEGGCEIGMASRQLKQKELDWGLEPIAIAFDGIALVVHPSNDISDLTKEEIQKIFMGQITNWSEVGGADEEILVVSREDGSGTRGAFEEILKLDGDQGSMVVENALIAEGNGAVKANIASKSQAIGYISLGIVDETVKALLVDGAQATVENIKSNVYGVSRPLNMATKGETSELARAYLDFVMSPEGQKIVAEHYIPVVGE
ncbi:phosphate ABC transporter substrate-binding protein [Gottschalkiaceae bacterium SANA]|nr:phosphate ABC transporter substrate-binding protein [Gottschalkiaceae bacterium SANA]